MTIGKSIRDIIGQKAIQATIFATTALAAMSLGGTGANAQGAFYQASAQEIEGRPGTLIRQEPMFGAPVGATAHRVLYRSTDPEGRPIAVSGVVIVPPGPAPEGGRPIVAWAHPTSGIVPRCAPSLAIFIFQQIQGARELLQQGYVIAATDYPGLGTPVLIPIWSATARRARSSIPSGSHMRCRASATTGTTPCGDIHRAARPRCSPA